MHALLSLSCSHLNATTLSPDLTLSHHHRALAVSGLNTAMSHSSTASPSELDAMLATCYALTFESSYAGIGITDFITMVRGCALMTGQIIETGVPTTFWLPKNAHYRFMESRLSNLPVISGPLVDSAITSFEQLEPLLTKPVDRRFYSLLLEMILPLRAGNSAAAYIGFTCAFSPFYDTTHAEFLDFIHPDNHIAQILLLHFLALQMLVIPLTRREWDNRAFNNPRLIMGPVRWGQRIFEALPVQKRAYVAWPMRVVNSVLSLVQGLRGEYDGVLALAGPSVEGWLNGVG
jgi:hypothetical protein